MASALNPSSPSASTLSPATGKEDPVLSMLQIGKSLLSVIGPSGGANIARSLIDVYLKESAHTSDQDYAIPGSSALLSILPEALVEPLEAVFTWVDRAVILGIISPEDIRKIRDGDLKILENLLNKRLG